MKLMQNDYVVYGIYPTNKTLLLNVKCKFSQSTLYVSGEAQDSYDYEYGLKLSDHELINKWFSALYIGNSIVSVRYEVISVLWSKQYKNTFVLVCKAPLHSNDIRPSNSLLFITPAVHGFKEMSYKDLQRDGFDVNEILWPKVNLDSAETNFDSKLGW